jgi:hypothetical protein
VPKIFGEFIKHGSLFTRLDAMPFGVEPVEGVYGKPDFMKCPSRLLEKGEEGGGREKSWEEGGGRRAEEGGGRREDRCNASFKEESLGRQRSFYLMQTK